MSSCPLHPADILAEIKAALSTATRIKGRLPDPSDDVLTEFIGVAYRASLKQDEGRTLAFHVGLLTGAGIPVPEEKGWRFHRLTPPRPFTEHELAKLASIAQTDTTLLCVGPAAPLQITGLIATGGSWQSFTENSGRDDLPSFPPPPLLTVSTLAPGHLTVRLAGNLLCAIEGGSIRHSVTLRALNDPHGNDPWTYFREPIESLVDDVHTRLDGALEKGHLYFQVAPSFRRTIGRLLVKIQKTRHGGALLFSKEEGPPPDIAVTYPCRVELGPAIAACAVAFQRLLLCPEKSDRDLIIRHCESLDAVRSEEEDYLSAVASFARVDGAVLLSARLEVQGFGGMIKSTSIETARIREWDAAANRWQDFHETLGTRHRSALSYCAGKPDRLAFVVSQDGDVRAMLGHSGDPDVFLWRVSITFK